MGTDIAHPAGYENPHIFSSFHWFLLFYQKIKKKATPRPPRKKFAGGIPFSRRICYTISNEKKRKDGGGLEYHVNPALLCSMFAVPSAVADQHLKLASGLSLKVLLWMLRHAGETLNLDNAAAALGQPRGEVIDALHFWLERGVVLSAQEKAQPQITAAAVAQPQTSAVTMAPPESPALPPPLPPIRPSNAQILARTGECPELRWLFQEAQRMLSRTIGYEGECLLLQLVDTYGLPFEVVPMLLKYCAEIGKTSNAYIEAVGRDWAQREIDSLEKADEEIQAIQSNQSLWREFCGKAGLHTPKPTSAQREYLQRWHRVFGYGVEMIYAAYEEMANHTGKLSFSYMNKVLQGWHTAGIKTPEEAQAASAAFLQKNAPKKAKAAAKQRPPAAPTNPSYDLDAYERSTLQVPVFKK
jgi:DnaD/phage-associated family protein